VGLDAHLALRHRRLGPYYWDRCQFLACIIGNAFGNHCIYLSVDLSQAD